MSSKALYLEKRLLCFLSLSCLGWVGYNHPGDSKDYRSSLHTPPLFIGKLRKLSCYFSHVLIINYRISSLLSRQYNVFLWILMTSITVMIILPHQAPSASLCVSILDLHSDTRACGRLILDLCNSLSQKLVPVAPGVRNEELDHNLVIR